MTSQTTKPTLPLECQPADGTEDLGGSGVCSLPAEDLQVVLRGVVVATKTPSQDAEPVVRWISSSGSAANGGAVDDSSGEKNNSSKHPIPTFLKWHSDLELLPHGDSRHLASLTLGVALLRQNGRSGQETTPHDVECVWKLIYNALIGLSGTRPGWAASRSAQGFMSIPLCSLIDANGNIEELFRFHVWLPEKQHGNPDFAVHSHQAFAQSWILAGALKDYLYKAEAVGEESSATHSEYMLTWDDGKNSGTAYKTHQKQSVVVNTKKFVRVTQVRSIVNTPDQTYSIPEATYHKTEVLPHVLHSTLFFFDAKRGFEKEARVLGPPDGESFTQVRDPGSITPAYLARMVQSVRTWQTLIKKGRMHASAAEWEEAMRAFHAAQSLGESDENFPKSAYYKQFILGELGKTYRRFGRFDEAETFLEDALRDMEHSVLYIELNGELGVVSRHKNHLHKAKQAFQDQYDAAKEHGAEVEMCRAIGNLGMANYQLSQESHSDALLDEALAQIHERIDSARRLKNTTWEAIGLARLSLCCASKGETKEAVDAAKISLEISLTMKDATVIAMSRFFYGRALLRDGQIDEAITQFDPQGKTCTPAMAFCKEPSAENCQYLEELIATDISLDAVDEQGYSALDYAVFSEDSTAQEMLLKALRQRGLDESEVEVRYAASKLRRQYRQLFQEKMRPLLLRKNDIRTHGLQRLRQLYAGELASNPDARRTFDSFKFVWYSDFKAFGKMPRSDEGLTRQFSASVSEKAPQDHMPAFVIFMSYRWLNPGTTLPDDAKHTQYRRMISAITEFLEKHAEVREEDLGMWVDFACVDQNNPDSGISAVPFNIMQCDAVISLTDDHYFERAWCSMEVIMVQTLGRSYNFHEWLVHEPASGDGNVNGATKYALAKGPLDLKVSMDGKKCGNPEDWPKLLFLARQSGLLGTS